MTAPLKRKLLQLPQFGWPPNRTLGQWRGDEDRIVHSYPEFITDKVGNTTTVKHKINCKDDTHIKQRLYPINPGKRYFVLVKIKEMECKGLIVEPLTSNWT